MCHTESHLPIPDRFSIEWLIALVDDVNVYLNKHKGEESKTLDDCRQKAFEFEAQVVLILDKIQAVYQSIQRMVARAAISIEVTEKKIDSLPGGMEAMLGREITMTSKLTEYHLTVEETFAQLDLVLRNLKNYPLHVEDVYFQPTMSTEQVIGQLRGHGSTPNKLLQAIRGVSLQLATAADSTLG